MALIVSDILTQTKAIALSVLGAPWKELRYVYDLTKNTELDVAQAYGVRPDASEPVPTGIVGFDTQKHHFVLVLSDVAPTTGGDDSKIEAVVEALYDAADRVFKQLVSTKINLAGEVLQVDQRAMEAPLILNDGAFVFLQAKFWAKYRIQLS